MIEPIPLSIYKVDELINVLYSTKYNMSNLQYYPLKRLKSRLGDKFSIEVQPSEKRRRLYNVANWWLVVETDHSHNILSIKVTPNFDRWLALSLKRAKTNWEKICWYVNA